MILSISDAAQLKKEINQQLSVSIHFHDGCSGQYFTIDETSEDTIRKITDFLSEKNLSAVFSEDGSQFTVEKSTHNK